VNGLCKVGGGRARGVQEGIDPEIRGTREFFVLGEIELD